MSASYVFALVIIVAAFNGFSIFMVVSVGLVWILTSYRDSTRSCVFALILISYISMVHTITLAPSIRGCAKVVQHAENSSLLEFDFQRFRIFEPFSTAVTAVCGQFEIEHAIHLHRTTVDSLARFRQAMRIVGVGTLVTYEKSHNSGLEHIRNMLKTMIFPQKEDSLFWMVHHSGIWISSFVSLVSSLLHLKLKFKTVNVIMHILICFFSWLSWDVRTLRLLMISSLKLLRIPSSVASYVALVSVIVMFPYAIVSPAFLFPFLFFVINTTRISLVKRWLVIIALQQWLFASWSIVYMFLYIFLGKVIFLIDSFDRVFPLFNTTTYLSEMLVFFNGILRFPGGIQGNTFFALLIILCIQFKPMVQKSVIAACAWLILVQPLRWIPQIHFINVGQGHATLIQYRSNDVLIDTGTQSNANYLMHFLHYRHVRYLDALLITHDDADHSGGVERLISEQFATHVYPHKTSWHSALIIDSLVDVRFDSSDNEDSAMYLVQLPNLSVLISGDAYHQQEKLVVNTYLDLKVDVLLVGHHGSRTSTHPNFISHLQPSLAIISAHSSLYGHPHRETLRTLQQFQVPFLENEHAGDISIYILPWFKLVLSSQGGFAIMK